MLFTCIIVIYCDNSTAPTDNTALLWIPGITEGTARGICISVGKRWFLIQEINCCVAFILPWLHTDGQGIMNECISSWPDVKIQSWTSNKNFLSDTVRVGWSFSMRFWLAFFPCDQIWMIQEAVYVGWSFCRAEMSRGGGARPLHSFSCPSLKRRLRAGRGTPDSAGGWLRGFDTPLSRSEGWVPSCQQRTKSADQDTR